MVFESVPVDCLTSVEDLRKVRNLLENNRGCWFTARDIAMATGLPVNNTQVLVRRAIRELIEFSRCPIVSCHAGYTWATCQNMVLVYRSHLLERAAGLRSRIRAVEAVSEEMSGQKPLMEW
jgi:hypothetical protein